MAKVQKGVFGVDPLPWEPLPYMEEYLLELEAQLRATSYIEKVKLGLAHFAQFCAGEVRGCHHRDGTGKGCLG